MADARTSIVLLTWNRAGEVAAVLERLLALPEQPAIVVVDNHSTDGTAALLAERFADLQVVRAPANLGAAGRNLGVAVVRTPYVAFCDDDTWWAPGALARAADVLDANPGVAALNARVLVGPGNVVDPTCERMAESPLPSRGLPGPALVSFMAGAVVVRRAAFLAAGGYERRFFLGAEEALLGLDLLSRGWTMAYRHDIVTHHHPSPVRDPSQRRAMLIRNRLWFAWLRLPLAVAADETRRVLDDARRQGVGHRPFADALAGLPWVLARRRAVDATVCQAWRVAHGRAGPAAPRSVAASGPR